MNNSRILIFEPLVQRPSNELCAFSDERYCEHVRNACFTLLTTEEASEHRTTEASSPTFPISWTSGSLRPEPRRTACSARLARFTSASGNTPKRLPAASKDRSRQRGFRAAASSGSGQSAPSGAASRIVPRITWATIPRDTLPSPEKRDETRFARSTFQRGFFCRCQRSGYGLLGANDPYLPGAVDHSKVVFCPDPCAMPRLAGMAEARAAYGIRPETRVVLVFGFIDRRKCVDVLLEGVARLDPDVDVTVLMAGQQHAGHLGAVMNGPVARALRERGRLIEVNRFIQFDREIDPMSAADSSWVFYEGTCRFSNVLALSGLAPRPSSPAIRAWLGGWWKTIGLVSRWRRTRRTHRRGSDTTGSRRRRASEHGRKRRPLFRRKPPANFARPIADAINRALSRKRLPA